MFAIATTINDGVSLFLKEVALLVPSPHATMQSDAAISSPKERLLFLLRNANLNLIFFELKGL